MDATTTELRSATVELDGGQVVHVCRHRDGSRDVLSLVKGWNDASPLPAAPESDVVELPGSKAGELIEALKAVGGDG